MSVHVEAYILYLIRHVQGGSKGGSLGNVDLEGRGWVRGLQVVPGALAVLTEGASALRGMLDGRARPLMEVKEILLLVISE